LDPAGPQESPLIETAVESLADFRNGFGSALPFAFVGNLPDCPRECFKMLFAQDAFLL
jgi:hypothetical protein